MMSETDLNRMAQAFYEASGLTLAGVGDKPKVVKGLKAVLANLDSTQYDTSPAQETMRKEMEEPVTVGTMLDDIFGAPYRSPECIVAPAAVTSLALGIINDHDSIILGMRQWQVVQEMVEHGIRTGVRLGQDLTR